MSRMSHKPLPRKVLLLGWVSFFADVSSEMIYPLMPLFVVGVLGASVGALGWIEGTAAALVALMGGVAGLRSDRVVGGVRRRVVWVRWGYGLPVLGKALLALATAWPMVLAGRLIDRLGKGLRSSPRDALIADAVHAEQRGAAFGLHRAMDTAGAFVGVLLATGLMLIVGATPDSSGAAAFRIVFAIAAGLGLISWAITWLVRDASGAAADATAAGAVPASASVQAPKKADAAVAAGPSVPGGLAAIRALPGSYWRVVGVLLLFALANSSDAFLLLRAREVGLSPVQVVLAYALFNLVYTLLSLPAGRLSDRVGRWRVTAVGWAIYAGVYAGFASVSATSGGIVAVWLLLAAYGAYMALTDGVGKALISDHAPKALRGTALGVFHMASGFAALAASAVAGALWDRFGSAAAFWFGGSAAAVAVAAVVLLELRGGLRPGPLR